MRVFEELKSGKCSIYAQWLAIIALPLLVILPFSYLTGSGLLIIWSILSWFIAFLVLVIEFPLFTRCFPEGSNLARFFKSSRYHVFRGGSYLLFAVVLGVSVGVRLSLLAIPAAVLFLSSLLYGGALWKREDVEESCLKGPSTDNQ